MYLSISYWIFSACRLKKHAYAGLLPSKNHASLGKNVRTNTRNSAFLRALSKYVCHVLHCVTNQRKNIPPEMTIQECVYFTIFSVHSLLQYIVSVTNTRLLYMDMTIALKSLNEMQQTASMRFTITSHDITIIYFTYFQIYYY